MQISRRLFLAVTTGSVFLCKLASGQTSDCLVELKSGKATSKSVDLSRLLACIAEVETGRKGPNMWQVTYVVWLQHARPSQRNRKDFERFCKGPVAEALALHHMMWLHQQNGNAQPAVFWLAYAWRAGLSLAQYDFDHQTFRTTARDYSLRVTNLYHDRTFA